MIHIPPNLVVGPWVSHTTLDTTRPSVNKRAKFHIPTKIAIRLFSCDGGEGYAFMDDSTEFSGGVCYRLSKASRREDLQVEQPVACWDFSSFDFHPTLSGMLSA